MRVALLIINNNHRLHWSSLSQSKEVINYKACAKLAIALPNKKESS